MAAPPGGSALKVLTNWAKSVRNLRADLYVFGSTIYIGGGQFQAPTSDVDLVAVLPDSIGDAIHRAEWLRSFAEKKQLLEVALMQALHRSKADSPICSVLAVTRLEIAADLHKTTSQGFFCDNTFRNLRTGKEEIGLPEAGSQKIKNARLIDVFKFVQGVRNSFLGISPNGSCKLAPWAGDDPLPKEIMRTAAMTLPRVRGQPAGVQFDVKAGLDHLHHYLYENSYAPELAILNDWLSVRRGARGDRQLVQTLPAERYLLLAEIIFDFAQDATESIALMQQPKSVTPSVRQIRLSKYMSKKRAERSEPATLGRKVARKLPKTRIPSPAQRSRASKSKLATQMVGSIPTNIRGFAGRRDVLNRLRTFLSRRGSGVYTLYGLGGCGKSATLLKFLTDSRLLGSKVTSRSLYALFIWSFYQNASLEQFFEALILYLAPLLAKDQEFRPKALDNPLLLSDNLAQAAKKILIVCDGLERIQDESQTGNIPEGAVTNPALRALLQRAGDDNCGSTKIIITSRLLVPNLSKDDSTSIFVSDLNKMSREDSFELLHQNGVRGEDREIAQAAREYSYHAYSLTLLSQLLSRTFRGDVRRRDRIPRRDSAQIPISRILDWYRGKLPLTHLRLMQALAVFREPILINPIHGVMLTLWAGEETDAPPSLVNTEIMLKDLAELGLAFPGGSRRGTAQSYDLHPLVRAFFYRLLVDPTAAHDKAWRILSATKPGYRPNRSEEIQQLIELIYHAIRSGRHEEAWRIYRTQLGGYTYLGTQRADHPTGSKVVRAFLDTDTGSPLALKPEMLARLFVDGALYLKNEGRLDDAIDLLDIGRERVSGIRGSSSEYISLLLNLSGVQLLRGKVGDAAASARAGRAELSSLTSDLDAIRRARLDKECDSRLASALAVNADPTSGALFERALAIPDSTEEPPLDYAAIRYGWLLSHQRRFDLARRVLNESLSFATELKAAMIVHRIKAQLAFVEIESGNLDEATALVKEISQWSTRADLHMFIQSWLARASLASKADRNKEAHEIAIEGARYAADNGFTLEWIDFQVLLAKTNVCLQQFDIASNHAALALNGNDDDFMFKMFGATDASVGYVWGEISARYLLGQSLQHDNPELAAKETNLARELMAIVGLSVSTTLEENSSG
jgi:tetratricopeptide (TPR) repeat protein